MRLFAALPVISAGATCAQTPITYDPFPAIQPGSVTVALDPFLTIPADNAGASIARITGAASDGTGHVYINSLNGMLYRTDIAGSSPTLYLDITKQSVGALAVSSFYQLGLAGVAFHPNFAGDPAQPGYGKFYTTSHTANTGTSTIGDNTGPFTAQIREWTTASPAGSTFIGTSREVLTVSGYSDEHATGTIAFNPAAKPGTADYGNLYISSGDGAYNDGNQKAQVLTAPQGKLLRINPLATVAALSTPVEN